MMQQNSFTPEPPSDGTLPRRALWALAVLALLVRVLYLADHSASPFFAMPVLDERYYDGMARALASGGDLRRYAGFRAMLYPLLLAGPYALVGAEAGRILMILLQHLAGAATVLLIAWSGARLARDGRAGVAAGVLYALAGPPLFFEGELMVESWMALAVAALMAASFRAVEAVGGPAIRRWLAVGVLNGVATQLRPNVLPALAVFPALAIWRARQARPAAAAPLAAMVGALLALMAFAPVQRLQSGEWQLIPGAGGINFYVGNKRGADGMIPRQPASVVSDVEYIDLLQKYSEEEYRRRMLSEGQTPRAGPSAVSRYWTMETLREIRAAPLQWLRLLYRKFRFFLWNYESPNGKSHSFVLEHESLLLRWLPVRWFLLLALLPLGLRHARRRGTTEEALTAGLFIALYGAGVILFFVNGRFRIPLWPALAVVGGGGLIGLVDSVRAHRGRETAAQAASAVAIAVFSLWPVAGAPEDDFSRDFFLRANVRLEQGDIEGAIADARESLAREPSLNDARLTLGNALLLKGDAAGAADAYRLFLRDDPEEPRGWNNLAAALAALGDWTGAHAAYLQVLDLRPDHPNALLNAAIIELRAGRPDLAAPRLEALGQAGMENAAVLVARAVLAEQSGEADTAAELRRRAESLSPALKLEAERELSSTVFIPGVSRGTPSDGAAANE